MPLFKAGRVFLTGFGPGVAEAPRLGGIVVVLLMLILVWCDVVMEVVVKWWWKWMLMRRRGLARKFQFYARGFSQ